MPPGKFGTLAEDNVVDHRNGVVCVDALHNERLAPRQLEAQRGVGDLDLQHALFEGDARGVLGAHLAHIFGPSLHHHSLREQLLLAVFVHEVVN